MLLGTQEGNVDLQGTVAKDAQKLCLSGYLRGHEVYYDYVQRTDVLRYGTVFGHHEDVFAFQGCPGGQIRRNSNGHGAVLKRSPRGSGPGYKIIVLYTKTVCCYKNRKYVVPVNRQRG